jgi:hypothetical protein
MLLFEMCARRWNSNPGGGSRVAMIFIVYFAIGLGAVMLAVVILAEGV